MPRPDTTAVIVLSYPENIDYEINEKIISVFEASGDYTTISDGTESFIGNDIVLSCPVYGTPDDFAIWNYCQSIIRSNELPFPEEHDVIILASENVREWREYFCPDTEVDVVQAIVWNDSYYLAYPEEISDYASDAFIGRYTEEKMAEHLADDDERLIDLDDDIRSAINLRDLYRDTMTYTMWHDGDLWFWNR